MLCRKWPISNFYLFLSLLLALTEAAATELSMAISHLIHVYSSSFDTDFQVANIPRSPSRADISLDSQLSFTVYAAHNIPEAWVNR